MFHYTEIGGNSTIQYNYLNYEKLSSCLVFTKKGKYSFLQWAHVFVFSHFYALSLLLARCLCWEHWWNHIYYIHIDTPNQCNINYYFHCCCCLLITLLLFYIFLQWRSLMCFLSLLYSLVSYFMKEKLVHWRVRMD